MMTSGEWPLIREESTPMKVEQGSLTQLTHEGLAFGEAVNKPLFQPIARMSFGCEIDAMQPLCVTFSC